MIVVIINFVPFCLQQLKMGADDSLRAQDVYDNVCGALSIIYMPLLMPGKIADPNMLPTPSMIQIFSDVAMDLSSDQQLVIHSTSLHFMAKNRLGDLHTFAFGFRHVPDTQSIVDLYKGDTGRELTIPQDLDDVFVSLCVQASY
jgi:hypothetical protein